MSFYLKSIGALYANDYVRRSKICEYCNSAFSDVTKRNLRHTCTDECDSSLMVKKRRERNSYVRTEDQKRKTSETLKEHYRTGTRVVTEAQRAALSMTMKNTWARGAIDVANHWSKTSEGRAYLSKLYKGKKLGPNPKLSLAAQKRIRTRREMMYTSAKGGTREDLGCYFRSMWEANFARILNFQAKKWEYEPITFQLEPSFSYTPDFFVSDENTYYEIKGRMNERSEKQLRLMKEIYPNVNLVLIDSEKYSELKVQFKQLLPAWEGK